MSDIKDLVRGMRAEVLLLGRYLDVQLAALNEADKCIPSGADALHPEVVKQLGVEADSMWKLVPLEWQLAVEARSSRHYRVDNRFYDVDLEGV